MRFRKRKPWGIVFDKLSNKPILSAVVYIYDAEYQKLKDTRVTDGEGRFEATITPGNYYLKIIKDGYQPLQSETVNIASPDQILNLEFFLTPIQKEFDLKYIWRIKILDALKRFIDLINPYLLAFGTIISLTAAIIVPTWLNYAIFAVYIILDALKIYFAFHLIKPFGKVLDQTTQAPLSLAVVRIFAQEKNMLLATKATDEQGRFNFLVAPGKYYLTCFKSGYQEYRSAGLEISKSQLAAFDIKMRSLNQ